METVWVVTLYIRNKVPKVHIFKTLEDVKGTVENTWSRCSEKPRLVEECDDHIKWHHDDQRTTVDAWMTKVTERSDHF